MKYSITTRNWNKEFIFLVTFISNSMYGRLYRMKRRNWFQMALIRVFGDHKHIKCRKKDLGSRKILADNIETKTSYKKNKLKFKFIVFSQIVPFQAIDGDTLNCFTFSLFLLVFRGGKAVKSFIIWNNLRWKSATVKKKEINDGKVEVA